MKPSAYSPPESLEQRIAPAGLVTLTFAGGVLTLDGGDGADHDISIVKTGLNAFRVEGDATDIGVLGQVSKNFRGILTSVVYTGGAGADSVEIKNLSPLKSFRFDGDGGVDALTMSNFKTVAGGKVDISLGAEGGSVNFSGVQTMVRGYVNLDLGGGDATFSAAATTVNGPVTVTGGLERDALSITSGSAILKKTLTFNGGGGDDSFTSTGNSLRIMGLVSMDGGAGANDFTFGAKRTNVGTLATPGGYDLELGEGAGSLSFLGLENKVLGALKIDLGAGGGSAHLSSTTTTIRDAVDVAGGAGNDLLAFDGNVAIGKSLSFDGGIGDDTLTASGQRLAVKGATTMDGGAGAGVMMLHSSTVALAAITFLGGTENDIVSIVADGLITGDASFQLGLDGTGPSSTTLQSKAGMTNGLKFGQTLTIDMLGATVDVLAIANVQVAKAFVAQTGEGVSTVDIAKLNARASLSLHTGAGADVVNLDNLNALAFTVDTGIGADELRIERNAAYTGISRVLGTATILTGIGADEIRIGNATNAADLRVAFSGGVTIDAGDGANFRNDITGSNSFASQPSILSTGGTLTQTEAV